MTLNEKYMNDIKKVDKVLKNSHRGEIETQIIKNYRESLILSYGSKMIEKCSHSVCDAQGYYKTRGKEIYESDRENADFRFVICSTCGEQIYLVKTDYSDWDNRLENNCIEVRTKHYCKKM